MPQTNIEDININNMECHRMDIIAKIFSNAGKCNYSDLFFCEMLEYSVIVVKYSF